MGNQKGQVLIIVLMITALMTGLLGFSAGFTHWVKVKNQTESICRKHYLKAQSYVIKYARRLKKLNPKAKKLRLRLAYLYAKLVLLKDPVSISATLWQIKKVKSKQGLLDAKQKSLINTARYKIDLQIKKIKADLTKISKITPVHIEKVPFKLLATPQFSKAPSYHLPPDFYQLQHVSAQWTWLELNVLKRLFSFSCEVGVKKKGLKWHPTLKKGNPLLSSL